MEETDLVQILILISPLIIATLKQSGFTKRKNSLIALGVCLSVATVDVVLKGVADPSEIIHEVVITLSSAFALYKMVFQPFGFDDWLTEKTSLIKR
ncbi:MAG: hypothetical protein AMJ88_13550 [Anaerolineae bacterium SM23_ 63]|nr:MAG: hypothetical protein AMJ88_13550 [Anaerolineae bacterium SM23_ 63]